MTSGGEGYYSFPLLVHVHYDLKVEKTGFEAEAQKICIAQFEAQAYRLAVQPPLQEDLPRRRSQF